MLNIILYKLEIFVNIINHKHCLIISVKYHSSNMNDVHTMSLADMLAACKSHTAGSILFKF